MKPRLRILCALLCVLLWPWMASSGAMAEAAPEAAPTIRVHLRRLALTDRADLQLDGIYTAETGTGASISFPRGSEVTVQLRDNTIYLFYEGMSLSAGESLRFVQHASSTQSTDGIRFSSGSNYYPGHLQFSISGGMLLPVLTLSVEDYLLGVVPYEMSDSFPLEALKAQAVCARTYALAHVNPSASWDVVDTTNDQVFRGINTQYQTAARAVRETAGIVGMYNGNLATCYYAASNGGQTELVENVWSGRGDWGYYVMVDDPYDLENPESIVRRARLQKSASGLSDEFKTILCNYMAATLTRNGYVPDASAFRVDSIDAVTLGDPAHGEASRLMTTMTITFHWSGKKLQLPTLVPVSVTASPYAQDEDYSLFSPTASPTPSAMVEPTVSPAPTPNPTAFLSDYLPAEEAATVTLDLFPDVVRALKLNIGSMNNELITVTETDTAFVLESRRYGHGVGMSQRGAQWMAGQYNMTFDQILSFYYPGMTLMVAPSGAQVLSTAEPNLVNTPGPAATPTPRPTLMPVTGELPEGAWLASVEGVDDDSSLNLRSEPSMAGEILMRLYKHQQLIVLETCEEPAWVHVKTDTAEGYVMVEFLEKVETESSTAMEAEG